MAIRRAFAQEDTDLQTATVTTSRVRQYTDIDLTFKAKPTSGEIYKKTDAAAVKQAVKTLVMTNQLEKPFRPSFGGNMQSQLFELADRGKSSMIKRNIKENIEMFEPRAKILDIMVNLQSDAHSLDVTVKFKVVNTEEEIVFTTTLARLR
jgi:phage baseplate assembly protein W